MTSSHTWKHINLNHTLCCSYQWLQRCVIWERLCWQLLLQAKRCRIRQTDRLFSSTKCLSETVMTGRTQRRGLGRSVTDPPGETRLSWRCCKIKVWNLQEDDRRARHRKVNCCQSGFESCWRWLQQRRDWITLSYFLCFSFFSPLTWLASPAGSPHPQAREPVTTSAFFMTLTAGWPWAAWGRVMTDRRTPLN